MQRGVWFRTEMPAKRELYGLECKRLLTPPRWKSGAICLNIPDHMFHARFFEMCLGLKPPLHLTHPPLPLATSVCYLHGLARYEYFCHSVQAWPL